MGLDDPFKLNIPDLSMIKELFNDSNNDKI